MAVRGRNKSDLGSSGHVFPITPDDANDLPVETAAISIAVGGTLRFKQPNQPNPVTVTLPAGCFPIVAERVYNTGTAATGITGFA